MFLLEVFLVTDIKLLNSEGAYSSIRSGTGTIKIYFIRVISISLVMHIALHYSTGIREDIICADH